MYGNNLSRVEAVLYGACVSGVALLLSPVVRNTTNTPAENNIGNEISEVTALREQNLVLQRVKREDDAKIKKLEQQVSHRIELLAIERKWLLLQQS